MIFRDPEGMTRVMSADKTIGQLIIRLASEVNESRLLAEELEDVALLLADIGDLALTQRDRIQKKLEEITGALS